MKRTLKKALSLLLSLIMLMSLSAPAFAKETQWISQSLSDVPVIRISGDGEKLVDENGNKVFHYKDFASILKSDDEEEGDDDGSLIESIINLLMPFLIDGLLNDNWEPYYKNLQKEISELFENSLLDKDGNPQYGTGLRQERIEKMNQTRHNDQAWRTDNGIKYYVQDRYWFYYDWRLDPIETAGEFKSFVDDITASTGCDEVGVIASCLGTNVVTAYLAVYPEHAAEHIRGVAFDGSVVSGAEMLSEAISGKFNVDAAAINRTLLDCGAIGMFDIDGFINTTLEMLDRTGALDAVIGKTKDWIYYKLVEGVTSALALSTFYTWPNYWACVSPQDYDTAMKYVFGPTGSEKRTEYAGLIAKLDNYNTVVRQRIPEILTSTVKNGVNFGVISKYGFQTLPICKTNYLVSDQFASVGRSSFGATTGTIYNDLSDDYIASRTQAGFGKYISPDGQIDASTCLFPDQTWFIKGSSHSNWSDWELRLLYDIASSKEQLTVDNSCWPSQFVVYSYTNPDEDSDGEIETMTADNCDTENWEAEEKTDNPKDKYGKIFVAVTSLLKWLMELISKIFKLG
ncbi:MAG: hypothetical protein IJB74_08995 [Clostridia bacterium]|nr:hypothetical protein [Clostridia bacterium]